MALTRKFLAAMGIEAEKVDEIIAAHTETVNALKEERDTAKAEAAKVDDLTKQLEAANAQLESADADGFKAKFEAEHEAFETYKREVTERDAHAAKETAAKAYLTSKGIAEKSMPLAMRYMGADIDALTLDDKGSLTDTATLDAAIAGDLAALVVETSTQGAGTATPPDGTGAEPGRKVTIPAFF